MGTIDLGSATAGTVEVRGTYKAITNGASGVTVNLAGAILGGDVAAILVDTAEIGAAGAGLTNINLPNQTMDITGNLSGSVGSVAGNVDGLVTGTVAGVTPAAVADLGTVQTGDNFAIVNGTAGLVAIDTVVDAVKVVTDALTSAGAANLALSAAGIIGGTVGATDLATTTCSSDLTAYAADELIGRTIVFTGGTALGQASDITDYVVLNGVITFTAKPTAPVAGDTFVIV